MQAGLTRAQALEALCTYNHEHFHLLHALTVEAVMRYYADALGYAGDVEFWGLAGLLHDIDFEQWPEEHCVKCVSLLEEAGATPELIHAVCCHGHGICVNLPPEHQMEKVLFASDELTGIVGAAAKMRPSKSCSDMEISSLKKKFKDKKFAAGCSRDVIREGAQLLGWELDELFDGVLKAMAASEQAVAAEADLLCKEAQA